ncbi:MAG: ComEC/Rec2 family competence protein [Spirochaetota bacterium]
MPVASAAFIVLTGRYAFPESASVFVPLAAGFSLASVLIAVTFPSSIIGAGPLNRTGTIDGNRHSGAFFYRSLPLLLGVVLGFLLLAAIRFETTAEETVWLGIPEERISCLEGFAVEDGFRSSRGYVLLSARLSRCSAADGSEADAGGRITFLLDEADRIPARGSKIRIAVSDGFTEGEPIARGKVSNVLNAEWKSRTSRFRYRIFSRVEDKIDLLSSDSAPLLKALLLGTREDLDFREMDLFRRAGCMHVLALSGMHLGVITCMAFCFFGIFGRKKIAAAGAGCVVIWYLFLAGFKPSLLRAAVMVLLGTAALFKGRRLEGRLILGSSFLLVSLLLPMSMYSLSFTLSFTAVAGITLTADRFHGFMRRFIPPVLSGALAVSLASQLFTAPIIIRNFGVLYPGGLVAAIPVGLLACLDLGMGLIYVIVPESTGVEVWRWAFDIVHRGMIECTRLANTIPGIGCSPVPAIILWGCAAAAVLTLLYAGDLRARIMRAGARWKNRGITTGSR